MPEKELHKLWKEVACNCKGEAEYPLPSGRRIDCLDDETQICAEVEFNGSRIPIAVQRLMEAKRTGKCLHPKLIVKDIDLAYAKDLVSDDVQIIPDSKLTEKLLSCKIKSIKNM
ncbi:MAG: hypothetical protein QW304_08990 [Thermoproteota archaeon]